MEREPKFEIGFVCHGMINGVSLHLKSTLLQYQKEQQPI